jgi:hypothetical protein
MTYCASKSFRSRLGWFRTLMMVPLGVGLLAGWVAGCGSDGSQTTTAAPISACEDLGPGSCGQSCKSDTSCGTRLYCSVSGVCTADCTSNVGCGAGLACDETGRCVDSAKVLPPGMDGGLVGDGSGGSGGSNVGGDGCADISVKIDKQIPTVVLLIDQSGSMDEKFGSSTRWETLRDALMNPTTGIVKNLEKEVRFGLALYTSNNGNAGGTCPKLAEVNIALSNYSAIDKVYSKEDPAGDTPTGDSIDAVVKKLVPFSEPGQKYIVLATDGEPDTCEVPNPQEGQAESIAAAQNAFKKAIGTFIISVGKDVSLGHMQDMANAGAGLPLNGAQKAPYYQANDQAALKKAFEDIINGVRSCTFTLNGTVDPSKANQGSVQLDGSSLAYGDANGWELKSSNEIEVKGTACEKIKTGQHSLTAKFPCGAVVVPK